VDKKTTLRIIKYLRKNKISDKSIQKLFFTENYTLWNLATPFGAANTEIVNNLIKICESKNDDDD